MPAPLDRESLKSMKRADLQRICKDYGIKANLKTDALIELLVDTTQASRPTPPPVPVRGPSNRIASRSTGIPRLARGSSTSSVIIHDSDEEESALTEDPLASSAPPSEPDLPPLPPPRPRRAKDTQYKLGVGRPTAAGGSGARTVTRSSSLSQKGRRGKGSKSAKPKEAVIQEEEEPDVMDFALPEAGPSGTTHEDPAPVPHAPEPSNASPPVHNPSIPDPLLEFAMLPVPPSDTSDHMKAYITNLVAPIQTQVQLLQAELQQRSAQAADLTQLAAQIRTLQTEVGSLRSQTALIPQLEAEIRQLKQVVAVLTQAHAPSEKSLGKARASDEGGSETTIGRVESAHATPAMPQQQAFPSFPQSLLGKRQRDLNDSQVTDFVEAGQESQFSQEDLERRVVRPTKKRAKLTGEEHGQAASSSGADPRAPTSENPNSEAQSAPRGAFTIFQGPEEPPESYIDPPPPTTHLSDLLFGSEAGEITPPNGTGGAFFRPPGADENAMHSNYNFSFDTSLFDAVTSTPFDVNLPPFTYPEPPTSPSPAAPSGGFIERAGGRIERNDLFQPIRRIPSVQVSTQSPSRPQSAVGRTPSRMVPRRESAQPQSLLAQSGMGSGGTVDPSMLMATTPTLSTVPETPQEAVAGPSVNMANGSIISALARRTVSSTEIGIQLGMSSTVPLPPDTPGAPMKRTMYGTELEIDTRFGDFGVEGVASGFWAGAPRRM